MGIILALLVILVLWIIRYSGNPGNSGILSNPILWVILVFWYCILGNSSLSQSLPVSPKSLIVSSSL